MELNVCILDLARKENDDNIMIVDIEISDSDTIRIRYELYGN